MLGISVAEFERKAKGMAKLNLVQQGAELSYLLLHDPAFHSEVRREHLFEVGKHIRLKENIKQVYEILDRRIDGFHFDFYVLSAAPVEVIQSALEGIVPAGPHLWHGVQVQGLGRDRKPGAGDGRLWKSRAPRATRRKLGIPADHVVYVGDGSSDIHVMLQVNRRDGFTIAVSESKLVAQIAKRTVLSDNALATLVPILEEIAGWQRPQIRAALRILRLPDSGMGPSADRLGHAAAQRRSGGESGRCGHNVNAKQIHCIESTAETPRSAKKYLIASSALLFALQLAFCG